MNASRLRPKKFVPHQCGPSCLSEAQYDPKALKGENPLVIPMLCAWERWVLQKFSVQLFYGDTSKLSVEAPIKTTFFLCFHTSRNLENIKC